MPLSETAYPVVQVLLLPAENTWSPRDAPQSEHMGSKEKIWFQPATGGPRRLVKFSRPDTGEHWSEKIGAEVAALLGVPHAEVDVGFSGERPVSVTATFLEEGAALIHGNELLADADPTYRKEGPKFRTQEHTVQAVRSVLGERQVAVPPGTAEDLSAFGVFVGYLLLDALIGNTDRHHENWGVIAKGHGAERHLELAPSYDHASSLGRELTDERRSALLGSRDARSGVASYSARAKSAFYAEAIETMGGQAKSLHCVEAWRAACVLDPSAAEYWSARLEAVSELALHGLVTRVPELCMSRLAKDFANQVPSYNLARLKGS
jgi:HipA-like C-terminal domain